MRIWTSLVPIPVDSLATTIMAISNTVVTGTGTTVYRLPGAGQFVAGLCANLTMICFWLVGRVCIIIISSILKFCTGMWCLT